MWERGENTKTGSKARKMRASVRVCACLCLRGGERVIDKKKIVERGRERKEGVGKSEHGNKKWQIL